MILFTIKKKKTMRKFIYVVLAFVGLGVISCSNSNQKNEETPQTEEEEIGCYKLNG